MRNRVQLFVIVGKAPLGDLADAFVRTLGRVQAFVDRMEPPFIGKVYRPTPGDVARKPEAPGRVERWYPREHDA